MRNASVSLGQRNKDYADLSCLRLPIYTDILAKRAMAGEVKMLEALEEIPSPEATAQLLRLARSAAPAVARAATEGMARRVAGAQTTPPQPASRGWDGSQAVEVRAWATDLLEAKEKTEVAAAARLLEHLGTAIEGPALVKALTGALEQPFGARDEHTQNVLDDPTPIRELGQALRAVHARGFTIDESGMDGGGLFVYFDWLADDPKPRPEGWLQTLDAFTQGRYPMVIAGLRSIPKPMPAACAKVVARSFEDPDVGVRRVACEVAGTSGDKRFIPLLLTLVAAEHEPWVLRSATNAAQQLGSGLPLLEIWAARLPEDNLNELALDALASVIKLPGAWGSNGLPRGDRLAQRAAWMTFLRKHAREIEAGKKFQPGHPDLQPVMFGIRQYRFPDGHQWPEKPAEEKKVSF